MNLMDQPFKSFSFEYTPSSPLSQSLLKTLFDTLGLERNQTRRVKSKDIITRRHALDQIVSSLLITLDMTEGHYCSRTIQRSSYTKEDFGRDTFDAVIQRLEDKGYVTFQRGTREPYSGYLSRVFLKRKLVSFFKASGIDRSNIQDHFSKTRRQSLKPIHMIEAKTSSRWSEGLKISGEDVVFSKLCQQPRSASQIKIMQDINSFLFSFDLRGPEDTSFVGLKRLFNNYTEEDYSFDQGGRLYSSSHINSYQSLSGVDRSKLTIDGEAVVEMDMHACALSITHALFGIPLPNQTDLYDIGGLDRSIVKSLINLSLTNGKPLMKWAESVTDDFGKAGIQYKKASHYAPIMLKAYPIINDLEQHNITWAKLQFEESETIIASMKELITRGIPSYPVHDSLKVPLSSQRVAERVLEGYFSKRLGGSVILK